MEGPTPQTEHHDGDGDDGKPGVSREPANRYCRGADCQDQRRELKAEKGFTNALRGVRVNVISAHCATVAQVGLVPGPSLVDQDSAGRSEWFHRPKGYTDDLRHV